MDESLIKDESDGIPNESIGLLCAVLLTPEHAEGILFYNFLDFSASNEIVEIY